MVNIYLIVIRYILFYTNLSLFLFFLLQFVNYYRFRESHPDYYTINPLDLSFIADLEVLSVLPYKEQTGRRILIYKLGMYSFITHFLLLKI